MKKKTVFIRFVVFTLVSTLAFFCLFQSVHAAPAPTVTSISPSSGPTTGGTSVTINGTGFAAGTVTIGGTSATGIVIVSATQITAITPAGTAGARDVVYTRTSDSKSGTLTGGFTYVAPDTTAPAAVTNLTASNATVNSIDVSWTAPGDDGSSGTATSYDIRYSTATINDSNWASATQVTGEPTPLVAGTSQSKTITGLSVSTTYYFAIKTSDEVPNESALSNVPSLATTAVPDTTAPATVSDLVASDPSNTTITLSWTSPGDDGSSGTATSYDIRYSTSAINDGNWASATQVTDEPTPLVAGASQSKTVIGLSPNTTYYFAIKTSDEVPNESALSNVPSLATTAAPDTTAPATVSDLAASDPSNTTITLSWTSPGDDGSSGTATSYDIRYSTSAINDGNWASATQVTGEPTPLVAGTSQSKTVTGLSANTTYYFAIKTSDEVPNESALSNVPSLATTNIFGDTTAPAAISNLVASSPSATAITLSWTSPGDDDNSGTATSYDIRYSTATINDSNWISATQITGEPDPQVAGTSQSKTVTGLSPNTTYYFAIKTSDEVPNESALSNITSLATIDTDDTVAPAAITNLAASNATANSMEISWSAPGDDNNSGTASSYDLRYATFVIDNGNWASATQISDEPSPQVAGTSQSKTVTGLTANTTYFFGIKTSDEVPNESLLSNIPSLATLAESVTPPSAPASGGGGTPVIVTFSGQAYPSSTIEVLRKSVGEVSFQSISAESVSIGPDGVFVISHSGIVRDDYLYALRIQDRDGRKTTLSFSVNLLAQSSYTLKDILIPPSVGLKNTLLLRAEDLQLIGYAAPGSIIEVEIDGATQKGTVSADKNGYYTFSASVGSLAIGAHYARVRQTDKDGKKSEWSQTKSFKKSLLLTLEADFNNDGKVNITDWSIFLFRWASSDQILRSSADIDGNGKVDIFDLSIFLKTIQI